MGSISVIIVSWNARNFLRDCLTSVYKTGGAVLHEVIVVDNASSDGSPEMVVEQFPQVKLIHAGGNLGFAKANNLAIQQATGSMLALINSDVIVHPECLQTLVAYVDSNPDVGLAGPKVFGRDGLIQYSCGKLPTVWNSACRFMGLDRILGRWELFSGFQMRHLDYGRRSEVGVLSGCFWLSRRSAVEKVGGLDERFFFYAEDIDWCKRFKDAGWKIIFEPAATAIHFGGGSSGNAPLRYSIEMLRGNLIYWKKHHGNFGRSVFYLLISTRCVLRYLANGFLRITCLARGDATKNKMDEDAVCLRWLLTGKGVE
jgi:GT2 family glycosyltransferase